MSQVGDWKDRARRRPKLSLRSPDPKNQNMGEKNVRRVAWSIAGLSALLIGVGTLLGALAISSGGWPASLLSHQLTIPLSGIVFTVMGALVLPHRPHHPIAWMLVGLGLLSGVEVFNLGLLAYMSLQAPGEIIPAPNLAHWLVQWIYLPRSMIPVSLLLVLFPDGEPPSRRWRALAWATVVGIVLSTVTTAFSPAEGPALGGIVRNPFAVKSQFLDLAWVLSSGLLGILLLACPASLVARFRSAKGIERQQLKWLVYTLAVVFVLFFLAVLPVALILDTRRAAEFVFSFVNLATIAIAIAVSIAVLRYRLYDIDVIINRTLVYGALTVSVVIIYMAVVAGLGALLQAEGHLLISLLATGLIAALFQPLRERLQRGVDRLFYGQRDDPLGALSKLGQRLEVAIAPEIVLPTLVETISQTLKLPYVAISLRSGDEFKIAAQTGDEVAESLELPLIYQGEPVGQLIASPRGPGESFSQADKRLLENIAHQAGPAAYAVQLTQDLRQSRVRLVTAREEERRRLRRDLHDGLGPVLASQGLKMAAVSQLLQEDPARAQALLEELVAQNEATVAEIRRLVYELRPAALDDLGLVGAVRDYASDLKGSAQTSPRLQVDVQVPAGGLPSLPAAIEVAAYRISTEGLTNIARHAQAHHAEVSFVLNSAGQTRKLHLEIADDGVGLPKSQKSGIGLISMRERAEEIGGHLRIKSSSGKGTRVVADLPLVDGQ
jgi:two-component system NarL family sensor kinase